MIIFYWSAVSGYISHEITSPYRVPNSKITHKSVQEDKTPIPKIIQRVVHRSKERKGQVAAIRLMKFFENSRKKK